MKKKFAILCLALIGLIMVIITFSGCNPLSKQIKTFNSFADAHPEYLAPKCVQHFPVVDSVGKPKIDSTHKADNKNYQDSLNNIKELADFLKNKLNQAVLSGGDCKDIIQSYQTQVTQLSGKVDALKQAYKPCKPDTVYKTTPVYRKDMAELAVWQNKFTAQGDSLKTVKINLKNSEDTSASRLKAIFIMGGVILAAGVLTLLKFLGKI